MRLQLSKAIIFTKLWLFVLATSHAQRYPLGLNPDAQRWRQIKTDTVHVIFPEGLEKQANRVANLVQLLYEQTASIGEKQKRVPIILHHRTTVSNGFVTLSPFRSEFYLTPPQEGFLGTGNWLDLLTIHEYRHIQQFLNARRGVSKVVSWVFGQNGWMFMRALALPRWFMEGDAICTETALTPAGRGRLPLFEMEYRSIRLSGRKYSYEKASAGSFRNFVPNHYNLGYHLTSYARTHYGNDIWKKVVNDAAHYRGIFYPFSRSLRRHTGMRTPQLYRKTMQSLDSLWQAEDKQLRPSPYQTVNVKKKRTFTSYQFPQFLTDTSLVVIKSSFDQIPTFYKITLNGKEEPLFAPGINLAPNLTLSVSQLQLTWAENTFDVRWANQDYSVIKTYHVLGKIKKKITEKTKYFAPALSPDASKVVAVEYNPLQECSLVILNSFNGDVLQKVKNPEQWYFTYPRWIDEQTLVVVGQKNQQHYLLKVNLATETYETLLEGGTAQMLTPCANADYVFFSWSLTGIQNIFALRLQDNAVFQVTTSRFGAFQPTVSPDGKKLAYADFSAMGYDLALVPIDTSRWQKVDSLYPMLSSEWLVELRKRAGTGKSLKFVEALSDQEKGNTFLSKVPDRQYPVRKFPKTSGIINIHSLQPFINPPLLEVQFQTDNVFSTLSGVGGVQYNMNERNSTFYGNVVYGQFFPVFEGGLLNNRDRKSLGFYIDSVVVDSNNRIGTRYGTLSKHWQETSYFGSITLPFNLTSGTHFATLRLINRWYNIRYAYTEFVPSNPRRKLPEQPIHEDGSLAAVEFRLRFLRQEMMAIRYLRPRWAQVVDIWYRRNISQPSVGGKSLLLTTSLYFPGLFRTHSFVTTASASFRGSNDQYQFTDNFFYARGYAAILHDRASKTSLEYAFPLFYPDLPLGSLAFVKRVYLNAFYDQSTIYRRSISPLEVPNLSDYKDNLNRLGSIRALDLTANSFGAELMFDIRWLRLLDSQLGIRASYRTDYKTFGYSQPLFWEFVLLSLGN